VDGCPAGIPIPEIFALLNQKHKEEGQPEADYAALPVRPMPASNAVNVKRNAHSTCISASC
jgi:predicted aldo/keto reductase-like oxidoreductase